MIENHPLARGQEHAPVLNLTVSPQDLELVHLIVRRVNDILTLANARNVDTVQTSMDLIVARNHNPGALDFALLLRSEQSDFCEDIGRLVSMIDRRTGALPPSLRFHHAPAH